MSVYFDVDVQRTEDTKESLQKKNAKAWTYVQSGPTLPTTYPYPLVWTNGIRKLRMGLALSSLLFPFLPSSASTQLNSTSTLTEAEVSPILNFFNHSPTHPASHPEK